MFVLTPASEGWGRYCFHRCLSTHGRWGRGGGTPVLGSFPNSAPKPFLGGGRVLESQVLSLIWYQVLSGDTPVPGSFLSLWSQVLSLGRGGRGYSSSSQGVPQDRGSPCQSWSGVPGQDKTGVLLVRTRVPHSQDWGTTPCPPPPHETEQERKY